MILEQIVAQKKKEVEQAKQAFSLARLKEQALSDAGERRPFKQAIARQGKLSLIAEIKKASPSKGLLRENFQPLEIAQAYAASGACALSVLTDQKFFQGDIAYLRQVHDAVKLPILRKDFIIDEYQLYESLVAGADAILLIARILSLKQLKSFCALCAGLKLAAVCEAHDQEDLDKIYGVNAEIIGINNRNLDTFEENLQTTARLIKQIPPGKIIIAESAIKTAEDVKFLQGLGVDAVLIGEAFMRSPDIGAKVKELLGNLNYGKN